MRTATIFAAIFAAGFLARGLWTGSAVQADGVGRGAGEPMSGDVNGDGRLDVSDAIYIISYLFRGGPAPMPIACPPNVLPATGQTKCYGGGGQISCENVQYPGQDGVYRAGCPSEGRYVNNHDGTVTDRCTALMWQGDPAPATCTWQDALKYCESLGLAGHDDWRLPNVNELQSIVDHGRFNMAIDPVFGAFSGSYWSSTTCTGNSGAAWGFEFHGGGGISAMKGDDNYVRAVRTAP